MRKNTKKRKKEKEDCLTGNEIRDNGAKTMSDAMKLNTTLTLLNLGCEEKEKKGKRKNKKR